MEAEALRFAAVLESATELNSDPAKLTQQLEGRFRFLWGIYRAHSEVRLTAFLPEGMGILRWIAESPVQISKCYICADPLWPVACQGLGVPPQYKSELSKPFRFLWGIYRAHSEVLA